MNSSILRNALLVALALPQFASASLLLVGWHDFNNVGTSESPDDFASGFSGILVKNTVSRDLGGDNGGGSSIDYGSSGDSSGSGNDGVVRVDAGVTGAVFSMTNSSGSSMKLTSLFFDATSQSPGAVLQVAYRIGVGAFQTLGSFTGLNPTGNVSNPALQADFSDLSQSLSGITVGNTQTIDFRFSLASIGARLDNVAIYAVPEPAGLLALGCVLGSGLMLRNRRSKAIRA